MGSSDAPRCNAALREKLLSGEPLHFKGDEPEQERTILAEWLEKAARKPVRIDVRNAIIRGSLNLKYTIFENEVSLIGCDILEPADFSYNTFKRNFDFGGTTFYQGADFTSRENKGQILDYEICRRFHRCRNDSTPAPLSHQRYFHVFAIAKMREYFTRQAI